MDVVFGLRPSQPRRPAPAVGPISAARACTPQFLRHTAPLQAAAGGQGRKRRRLAVAAQATARAAIDEAKGKFQAGDRMGALRAFERVSRQDVAREELLEALYGTTVVHASFGDIEQAQMSLRESLEAGLDFETALKDARLLPWKSSPQVLSQLRKFARSYQQVREAVQPQQRSKADRKRRQTEGLEAADGGGRPRMAAPDPNMSLAEMLRTDITGMDATVTGIVKRVAGLLVVGLLLGTVLFFGGLKLTGIAR